MRGIRERFGNFWAMNDVLLRLILYVRQGKRGGRMEREKERELTLLILLIFLSLLLFNLHEKSLMFLRSFL